MIQSLARSDIEPNALALIKTNWSNFQRLTKGENSFGELNLNCIFHALSLNLTMFHRYLIELDCSNSSLPNWRTIKDQFHSTSTILIKTFNSLPTFLILRDQDRKRASFQIWVPDLILLIMEGRLRHASGPAHYNIESVTYVS